MKSKKLIIASLVMGTVLFSGYVYASDYSDYTTEELHSMRGTMQNATAEERSQFSNEWQKRSREMPDEERSKYTKGSEDESADGSSEGKKKAKGKGHGKSQGGSESYGSSMGGGSGEGGGHGGDKGHGGGRGK